MSSWLMMSRPCPLDALRFKGKRSVHPSVIVVPRVISPKRSLCRSIHHSTVREQVGTTEECVRSNQEAGSETLLFHQHARSLMHVTNKAEITV